MTVTRAASIVAFLGVFVGFAALEWAARREGARIPTLGDVCGVVLRYRVGRLPVGRLAVYGFWWWVGWHFFAR